MTVHFYVQISGESERKKMKLSDEALATLESEGHAISADGEKRRSCYGRKSR